MIYRTMPLFTARTHWPNAMFEATHALQVSNRTAGATLSLTSLSVYILRSRIQYRPISTNNTPTCTFRRVWVKMKIHIIGTICETIKTGQMDQNASGLYRRYKDKCVALRIGDLKGVGLICGSVPQQRHLVATRR